MLCPREVAGNHSQLGKVAVGHRQFGRVRAAKLLYREPCMFPGQVAVTGEPVQAGQPAVGFSGSESVTGRVPDAEGLSTGFQRVGYEVSTTAAPPRRECARRGLDPIPPPNREDEAMQDTVDQVHGAVPRALADIVGVIGVSSWPTACRAISSIWMARAAPVETNAS